MNKTRFDNIKVVSVEYASIPKKKFLIALPCFPNAKGFCHQTVLVSAIDENDAIDEARYLRPNHNIGDIKEVNY